MSDKSNLANTNNEPSMEDILSSIRKVIAEDLINEETQGVLTEDTLADIADNTEEMPIANETIPVGEADNEPVITDALEGRTSDTEDILELDTILTELPDPHTMTDEQGEVLELVTLEDDLVEGALDLPEMEETNEEAAALENLISDIEASPDLIDDTTEMDMVMAANASVLAQTDATMVQSDTNDDMDFDETLDLVMDSDASDYVTTNITTSSESGEMEIEGWRDRTADKAEDLDHSPDADTELQAVVDKAVAETVAETRAEETLTEEPDEPTIIEPDLLDEDMATDAQSDIDETIFEKPEPQPSEPQPIVATPDEDMDLVKSLLDDLMDEPTPEDNNSTEAIDSVDINETVEADFTNEILFREETDHSQDEQDMIIPEPDLPSEREAPEPDTDVQSTLAQIAKDIEQASDATAENSANPDDVVTLETPDLVSKLALTGGSAIGSAAAVASLPDAEPQETPVQPTTEPEPEQTPQPSLQEEEVMATPLKTETLSAAETSQEAGSAFASLTTAVQDKALAEENGPPIGELVKEALKPMLQEWLDANLKTMVQRAVTKEIKRISSGK